MKAPKLKSIPSKVVRKDSPVKMDNSYNPQPSLRLDAKILPEIKSWKVGETYKLEIEVKMTGIQQNEYGPDKESTSADFRITKIGTDTDNDD